MSSNGTCFSDGIFKEKKQHGILSRDTKSYREHFVRLEKKIPRTVCIISDCILVHYSR